MMCVACGFMGFLATENVADQRKLATLPQSSQGTEFMQTL